MPLQFPKKECYLTFVYDIIITSVRYWQLLCISCRYYISFLVKGQTRQRLLAYLTRHNIKGYTSYINMNKYSIYILVSNAKILRLMCVPFPRIYWKAIYGIMQNKKCVSTKRFMVNESWFCCRTVWILRIIFHYTFVYQMIFYLTCQHVTKPRWKPETNPNLKRWHCYACACQRDRVTCEHKFSQLWHVVFHARWMLQYIISNHQNANTNKN